MTLQAPVMVWNNESDQYHFTQTAKTGEVYLAWVGFRGGTGDWRPAQESPACPPGWVPGGGSAVLLLIWPTPWCWSCCCRCCCCCTLSFHSPNTPSRRLTPTNKLMKFYFMQHTITTLHTHTSAVLTLFNNYPYTQQTFETRDVLINCYIHF